ncbi:MAG: universal stress protein [Alphaproteobacteria bacterium]
MAIKTILVPVVDAVVGRSAVATAFLTAYSFRAHVVGLHVPAKPDFTAEDMMMSRASLGMAGQDIQEMLRAAEGKEAEATEEARRMFAAIAEAASAEEASAPSDRERLTAAFEVAAGADPEAVAAKGRLFDLVVVSQPRNDPGHRLRTLLRAVLFDSGRPILVAPEKPPETIGETVLIAWNGSALSARAAAISRQHFRRARKVCVLSVLRGARSESPAQQLADYLSWHGIEASVVETELGQRRLGDVFLEHAAALGADLLVMGAYAQSPFRESLTGGVTNYILSNADVPVLMTH